MRKAVTLTLALLLATTFVACGSDSEDAGSDVTTTVAASTTAAPTTEAAETTTEPEATDPPSTEPTTTVSDDEGPDDPGDSGDTVPGTYPEGYIPEDPDAYADAFVKAWAAGDREAALVFGTVAAVDTIFAYEAGGEEGAPPPSWDFVECEGAAGSSYCTFNAGGDPTIIVRVMNEAASMQQEQAVTEVQIES